MNNNNDFSMYTLRVFFNNSLLKKKEIECYTLNRKITTPMLWLKQIPHYLLSSRCTKANIGFFFF